MPGKLIRRLDSKRRITLPLDIIDYGWTENTPLCVTLTPSQTVIIEAHHPLCWLCGGEGKPLIPVDTHYICKNCLQTAREINDIIQNTI
ncbi:MAG: hypothetical protein LBV27_02595 [Oscillospiraceae bacterium]|jgi:hypothetical protein|nr:hypothetical protein [Oscillospiraceae bacterium]